jgi:hypothetical protein
MPDAKETLDAIAPRLRSVRRDGIAQQLRARRAELCRPLIEPSDIIIGQISENAHDIAISYHDIIAR